MAGEKFTFLAAMGRECFLLNIVIESSGRDCRVIEIKEPGISDWILTGSRRNGGHVVLLENEYIGLDQVLLKRGPRGCHLFLCGLRAKNVFYAGHLPSI